MEPDRQLSKNIALLYQANKYHRVCGKNLAFIHMWNNNLVLLIKDTENHDNG
jgi:hypothetical protein